LPELRLLLPTSRFQVNPYPAAASGRLSTAPEKDVPFVVVVVEWNPASAPPMTPAMTSFPRRPPPAPTLALMLRPYSELVELLEVTSMLSVSVAPFELVVVRLSEW